MNKTRPLIGDFSMTITLAERLADYAASLNYEDLPPETIEAVKRQFVDAIGCGLSAIHQTPIRTARKLALSYGKGNATVLGTHATTSPEMAAFVNGAAVRHYDYNDIYAAKEITHPSDNVPGCLAVAQAQGANGRDLILSIALVYELVCRFADAAEIASRGWDHSCYSLPSMALAAGKLMKLTPRQMTEALNIALGGHLASNQIRVQALSNWKGLADGNAARNAVFATLLAADGMTGPSPIFEGKLGFFKCIAGGPFDMDIDRFGGRSGHLFRVHDCTVKMYPALGMAQTAVPAALDVARQVGDVSRIRAVRIHTTAAGHMTAGSDPQKWAPPNSETADHSLPYIVARAMFDGDIDHQSYDDAALFDPKLLAFLKNVTVEADPALTALYPKFYPTRVTAVCDDGSTFSKQVNDTAGFPSTPMQRPEYERKFRKNMRGIMDEAQTAALLDQLWHVDECQDLSALCAAMAVIDQA
jgi:2-methylcitrate dehydratase